MNSLWGRFALRNRLSQSVLVNNAIDLAKHWENENLEINMMENLYGDTYLIGYQTRDEEITEHDCSNLVLALWTTSCARVHLLSKLYEAMEGREDVKLLYMGTDSMILEFDTELSEPIVKGDQLEQLGDEHPDKTIGEFVCSGPKSYVLRTKEADGKENFIWRCKGVPLNVEVMGKLSFGRFKDMNLGFGDEEADTDQLLPITNNFRIQRKGEIFTIPMEKNLRPTINKGNVDATGRVRFSDIRTQSGEGQQSKRLLMQTLNQILFN